MLRRVVGLEIGPETIRAVQIKKTIFGKLIIEKCVEAGVGKGVDQNGRITNTELLASQLKSLWAIAKFSSKHVALGLGGSDVFVREFSVPELNAEDLASVLPSLAEGSLPMPTSELSLDFYPSRLVEVAEQTMVSGLLLAATRVATDALVTSLEGAGLQPDAIDLVPFSVLRQMQQTGQVESVVAIAHAAAGFLNVIVARGHVPIFIRMVPLPLFSETQEPAENSDDVPESDAEILTEEMVQIVVGGALSLEAVDLESSSGELQDAAIRELKETLAYYERTYPDEPISKLYTSGKGLDNSDWLMLLSQQIWLPTESHTQTEWQRTGATSGKLEKSPVPTEYLVALALAKGSIYGR